LSIGNLGSSTLNALCDKSRMMGDYHVRFRERFGGETPPYLLDGNFNIVLLQAKLSRKYFITSFW
jgi:hypothetical protein